MIRGLWALACCTCLALSATGATACDRPAPARDAIVTPHAIDQPRLSRAILAEVNYARCTAGLRTLAAAPETLTESATAHSDWMARSGRLSHRGRGTSGRELMDRVRFARLRVQAASENIAQLPRYTFGTQRFRVIDRGACVFADRQGQQIPPHSYASLAQRVVTLWLDSPGHRRNILAPNVSAMAAGTAFSQSDTCGDFWITQVFVG